MKKILCMFLIVLMVISLSSVVLAQPKWNQPGELPPGLQGKGGPPGLVRQAQIEKEANELLILPWEVSGERKGQVIKFTVVMDQDAVNDLLNGEYEVSLSNEQVWNGEGIEMLQELQDGALEESKYNYTSTVIWTYTSGGAKGRGTRVLSLDEVLEVIHDLPKENGNDLV
jgi:hypothetical protein